MSKLKQQYGSEITLLDDRSQETSYQLMAEISHQGKDYAILQNDAMKKEGDIEVFLIVSSDDGDFQLETIDDEEWEAVAELYDELVFQKMAGSTLEKEEA